MRCGLGAVHLDPRGLRPDGAGRPLPGAGDGGDFFLNVCTTDHDFGAICSNMKKA